MSCVVQVFSVRLWVMRVFHEKVLLSLAQDQELGYSSVAPLRAGVAGHWEDFGPHPVRIRITYAINMPNCQKSPGVGGTNPEIDHDFVSVRDRKRN